MAAAPKTARRSTAQAAKKKTKTAAKKTAAKKAAPVRKPATKKPTAKKGPAKKATPAKKAAAKKAAPARKTAAKKAAPAKKAVAKKTATKKAVPAKKAVAKKARSTKKAAAKKAAPAKKAAAKKAVPAKKAATKTTTETTTTTTTKKIGGAAKKTTAAKKQQIRAKAAEAKAQRTRRIERGEVGDHIDAFRASLRGRMPSLDKLVGLGREVMGISDLRPGQAEALEQVLARRDVLAVMPTGSGKSLLYQLPSLALPGLTVVVSPLIALIKDQIDKMKALGVAVCRADSTLTVRQKREMEALAMAPGGKLMFTTPERIAVPEFREFLRGAAGDEGVSLFVVDEAHCVSQWGHDFRPSYLTIRKALEELGRPPVLATTATAPPHVREDILFQLGMEDAEIVTTTFDRPNLHYEVIALPGDDDKTKTLVTLLKKLPRPGIVYCATVKMVETLYEAMGRHGIPVARYHGRLTKTIRDAEQQRFMEPGSSLVMIATNAFGLGVDKADIRYVLHYHVPGSLEAYAQEAGRGGRDGKPARCVLLFSPDDVAIQEYFLKGTYPTRAQVWAVYRTLGAFAGTGEGAAPTISNVALSARVGSARTRTVLTLLKDEGFVVETEGNQFRLADPPLPTDLLREKAKQYEGRRIADRQRLDALLAYVGSSGCRSQVILSYLGEEDPPLCGRCDNCLRSKEAAMEASRDALQLERSVTRELDADWRDEEERTQARRVIRHRVIRIDEPPAAEAEKADGATESEPVAARAEKPARAVDAPAERGNGQRPAAERAEALADEEDDLEEDELEEDELEEDEDGEFEDEDGEFEDEDGEFEDDEDEDEDGEFEDGEFEDDEDDEDDDEYEIRETAAALAEEGYTPEGAEITILARKKVPKPPKQKKPQTAAAEDEPTKKKRRRRRRRRTQIPPKSAFVSPVLAQSAPPQGRRGSSSGPVIEYVRGPLRINMTPVASATPNDNPQRKKKRRRRPGQPGGAAPGGRPASGGGGVPAPARQAAGSSPAAAEAGQPGSGKKRRRRRRRRKKSPAGGPLPEGPVTFFSMAGQGSGGGGSGGNGNGNGNGGRKRRRRRRRRGRGGGDAQQTTPSSDS